MSMYRRYRLKGDYPNEALVIFQAWLSVVMASRHLAVVRAGGVLSQARALAVASARGADGLASQEAQAWKRRAREHLCKKACTM